MKQYFLSKRCQQWMVQKVSWPDFNLVVSCHVKAILYVSYLQNREKLPLSLYNTRCFLIDLQCLNRLTCLLMHAAVRLVTSKTSGYLSLEPLDLIS